MWYKRVTYAIRFEIMIKLLIVKFVIMMDVMVRSHIDPMLLCCVLCQWRLWKFYQFNFEYDMNHCYLYILCIKQKKYHLGRFIRTKTWIFNSGIKFSSINKPVFNEITKNYSQISLDWIKKKTSKKRNIICIRNALSKNQIEYAYCHTH